MLKDKLNIGKKFNIKEKLNFDKMKEQKISPTVLAIIILVLLLICAFVLFFEVNDYRKIREETYDFYYYFLSDKVNFEATLSINGQDRILDMTTSDITIDSTPIYYEDYARSVILPSNMEIVYPYKKVPMYKLGAFSKIYYKNNVLYIDSEAGSGRIYDCFMYNGENLYFFIETTTVKIGEETYELSPLSFIEVDKYYIRLYDMYNDNYIYIDNPPEKAFAYTEEYMINLYEDTFSYGNSYYLLIRGVDGLNFVEF